MSSSEMDQIAGAERPRMFSPEQTRLMENWFKRAPGFVVLLSGPNYVIELGNDAYFDLVRRHDVLSRPVFEALPEMRDQGFEELLKGVYETGKPYVGHEARIARRGPDGARIETFIDFVYQPVFDEHEQVCGIFVQGEDVTERRRAIEALQQADRRRDQSMAILAHELKRPLQPLMHAAQLLRRASAGHDSARQRAVETIERQVTSINRLIDDLADAVRVRTGRLALKRSSVTIQDVVAHAIEVCEPDLKDRGHVFYVELPEEPVVLDADPGRLQQALVNLLSNASKFTPSGGVVTLSVEPRGENVLIRITDSGIGIAADRLHQIFDMFLQMSEATYQSQSGLGIGLPLVRKLVELHGGSVSANSPGTGRGSEFVVSLPLPAGISSKEAQAG